MELAQLHITVTDIDRSVAFYRDVLGLDFLFDVPDQKMAFLQAGSVRVYLGEAESPDTSSHPIVYYRAEALDDEYERLLRAGAPGGQPPHRVHADERHELWMASVLDPDGHHVILMEERPSG